MRHPVHFVLHLLVWVLLTTTSFVGSQAWAETQVSPRPLTVTDIMKFREIKQQVWSESGHVYAYSAVPDRGDATGYVVRLNDTDNTPAKEFTVVRGTRAKITKNGGFVAFLQQPTLLAREQASSPKERRALAQHAVLVNTQTGEQRVFENIESFDFTGDDASLVLLEKKSSDADDDAGQRLIYVNLTSGAQRHVPNIAQYQVAEQGPRIALLTQASDNTPGQVLVRNTQNHSQLVLHENVGHAKAVFAFDSKGTRLAMATGAADSEKDASSRILSLWQYGEGLQQRPLNEAGWQVSEHTSLRWILDDAAFVFGTRPMAEAATTELGKPETEDDLYSLERILSDRTLQVWHGEDDRIMPQQRVLQKRLARATADVVYWIEEDRMVRISDNTEYSVRIDAENTSALLFDATPYLREYTWNGSYLDLYHVNLKTGEKQKVASRLPYSWAQGSVSPNGRYVAYVNNEKLHVFDSATGSSRQVASKVDTVWVDELQDRPSEASAYGFGGWLADSTGFYAYDRYDIWLVTPLDTALNITLGQGRANQTSYRIEKKAEGHYRAGEPLLVKSFHDRLKTSGFHRLNAVMGELENLRAGKKTYRLAKQFPASQRVYFTEQDFRQFPNMLVADTNLTAPVQVTDVNPQQSEFIWGTAELVEWESQVGETLQGVLLKPDNYDPNRAYPMVVYYYEKFSQRVYQYNQMKVNHRPNFPFYLGQDYLVFLPDIHFRLGAPGPSATESLVPAMEMLIEQGIADPKAIGLHGHSWSGYQTAFVVTETDMFAAAVSGAPVSNMTSAYSGIRWQSGLARQFQYERGQSRIGESLVENLDAYIKNSPVFFADKINTPMLIQFGDKDGAVPWEQGIEYYLALRRQDKPVVMLQYEGEPHHLQKYANKVDYTLKMLEFFDHYLKGAEAPQWWTDGLEFQVYE
ncbi:S9 family peptidase [Aliidiomarina taiwanensis]|uniref:S9 family peptidase n=1 Tax=Aliidiomarina taiwanensis TaxID=946228 RepID=A0A432X961_9GAMM|nr:prolyl oligopeptidase family serine peptidase [Aliidiomarina taiwanensis]RUO43927.1 S9 family peptidase [Aliidiomarina taiwanensis]